MEIEKCQAEAGDHLQKLLATGGYDWCQLNDNIDSLRAWFDPSVSWASFSWFLPVSWLNRINYGNICIHS